MIMERDVTFDCGHEVRRVCRNGRSLIGEQIHCHVGGTTVRGCGIDRAVVSESDARPLTVRNAKEL